MRGVQAKVSPLRLRGSSRRTGSKDGESDSKKSKVHDIQLFIDGALNQSVIGGDMRKPATQQNVLVEVQTAPGSKRGKGDKGSNTPVRSKRGSKEPKEELRLMT